MQVAIRTVSGPVHNRVAMQLQRVQVLVFTRAARVHAAMRACLIFFKTY
eukprot:SAG22_NODE_12928_length_424_cov_1.360000_1_plen_48_part_01